MLTRLEQVASSPEAQELLKTWNIERTEDLLKEIANKYEIQQEGLF